MGDKSKIEERANAAGLVVRWRRGTRAPPEAGKGRTQLLPGASRRHRPCGHPDFGARPGGLIGAIPPTLLKWTVVSGSSTRQELRIGRPMSLEQKGSIPRPEKAADPP